MIPSLKDTHRTRLQRTLQELRDRPELLQEFIDQKKLNEMENVVRKLNSLLSAPEFKGLSSFHLGLEKAHQDLKTILGYGELGSWAHSLIPKGFTAIGRIASFSEGIIRVIKQLPQIINIVKDSMSTELRAKWDPSKPLDELMDDETMADLHSIIVKAMKRPDAWFSDKLPYIDNEEAATELLTLSLTAIQKLSSIAGRSPVIHKAEDSTKEIEHDAQQVVDSGTETDGGRVGRSLRSWASSRNPSRS